MERDFAGARLSPGAFQTLAAMCQGDKRFPARYEDWELLVRDGTQQARADGRPTDEFAIDVDEFLAWCRKVAILPCFDALRAYLIIARSGTELLRGSANGGRGTSAGNRAPGNGHRVEKAAPLGTVWRWVAWAVVPRIRPGATTV